MSPAAVPAPQAKPAGPAAGGGVTRFGDHAARPKGLPGLPPRG